MNTKILTSPPTRRSAYLASHSIFQRFSTKYCFALITLYVQEKSFSSTRCPIFSKPAHLKCYTFHQWNPLTGKVRNISGEKPELTNPDKKQIISSQKRIQQPCHFSLNRQRLLNIFAKSSVLMFDRALNTLLFLYQSKFVVRCLKKEVVCVFYTFVEKLYLFLFTPSKCSFFSKN